MLFLALLACEPMPSSGEIFAPVKVEAAKPTGPDERFAGIDEPRFKISSEEMASGTMPAPAPAAGEPSPADAALGSPAPVLAAGAPVGLPSSTSFPVRLVSTIVSAQPPRAVVGLPSGEEVVVSPGSVLATEGLVVMAVMDGRVQLAKIKPQGDHAAIESLEISAQYP
ncbi:MAG: hypothetical protein FJ090_16235 [Deltaproteobacteria bacterium]|nr:hypothetical protein [Deltaproteobacteria bacterium]